MVQILAIPGGETASIMTVMDSHVDLEEFGDANNTTEACGVQDGLSTLSDDCDDSDANINPRLSYAMKLTTTVTEIQMKMSRC